MCWSGEASAAVAALGISTTAYAAYKKEPIALWATLGYFSLMELLQAFTYIYLDDCDHPMNQILTLLGYLHIAFQPFFVNALSLYFIPAAVRQKVAIPVYTVCFVSAIFMLIQLYPFEWSGTCSPPRILCGETLCSVSGNWHIAWNIPLNRIAEPLGPFSQGTILSLGPLSILEYSNFWQSYFWVSFLMPIVYGSWRAVIYHAIMGPFLASLLTDNNNEFPAIWCLLSIGFLVLAIKTPLRQLFFVRGWWLWPKSLRVPRTSPQEATQTAE